MKKKRFEVAAYDREGYPNPDIRYFSTYEQAIAWIKVAAPTGRVHIADLEADLRWRLED